MDIQKVKDAVINANCALKLDRKIVGVKFLFDEEEFNNAEAKKVVGKMPYCVMVKTAMSGRAIKASLDSFGCLASAKALGILDVDEFVSSGRRYRQSGLYQDLATSKNVFNNMTICTHKAYAVLIKPVEEYIEVPDVVLIITKPYNAMRIIQGYSHIYGYNTAYKMVGNQAVCSECTAYPFESNNINVSLLCSGTRFMSGWGEDEMAIGIPFNKFTSVIDGIYATLNATEPN